MNTELTLSLGPLRLPSPWPTLDGPLDARLPSVLPPPNPDFALAPAPVVDAHGVDATPAGAARRRAAAAHKGERKRADADGGASSDGSGSPRRVTRSGAKRVPASTKSPRRLSAPRGGSRRAAPLTLADVAHLDVSGYTSDDLADPERAGLTEAQVKKLRRRLSNRDSARRVRARRDEAATSTAARLAKVTAENEALAAKLADAHARAAAAAAAAAAANTRTRAATDVAAGLRLEIDALSRTLHVNNSLLQTWHAAAGAGGLGCVGCVGVDAGEPVVALPPAGVSPFAALAGGTS